MKFQLLPLIAIGVACSLSCSGQHLVELPLTQQDGYGYFRSALAGISTYSEEENDPWKKTHLSVTGAPKNWTDVKYGDIETNMLQTVYQNYLLGNITKEWYEELQKSWDWVPDTLALSKEPLKCKIAFAMGKDPAGVMNMVVDANNNLDLSDDIPFVPFKLSPTGRLTDSVALSNAIQVSFERLGNTKKQLLTAPLFIGHLAEYDAFMYNFPQYSIAEFKGEKMAVCSDGFTSLSYTNAVVALIPDTLKKDMKINPDRLIEKNEFIEVKGELYRNVGVNTNKNTLILEKMAQSKSELYSTQVGFKAFPFEGSDFVTASNVSSSSLKGKYVLLDFWAVWCGPCIQELPHLKKLQETADKDKFQIISIVAESPLDQLKAMIKKDSITWTQIVSDDSNKIKETYGIQGYPTTFLIDPDGVIVAKNLRGKDLEEKIFSLMKK
ncbi:thiol-disulfide isomerase/thioredoxin [Rhabdobacter roseus]|uniref:Thiol-disulfide isomerase/thioredoxin n=1 Tax=Rhabdobacter roseus TaxID=1655419 RepID=A0A840TRM1_9BACT|nr:TlpA disulfide reductase family protein [Rhabdobacter roseus]MBB5286561.1 thiol-disulfide isomerase/thioredoxin [Rhabdobacter roseus]